MRKDVDKDGRLSRSEIGSRLTPFFETADADKDTLLTLNEIKTAMLTEPTTNE